MIYGILICIIIVLLINALIHYYAAWVSMAMIAEFEKWANKYGYTFLTPDHSIKYPDTVNSISSVIDEIEDIVRNGYDGKGGK